MTGLGPAGGDVTGKHGGSSLGLVYSAPLRRAQIAKPRLKIVPDLQLVSITLLAGLNWGGVNIEP